MLLCPALLVTPLISIQKLEEVTRISELEFFALEKRSGLDVCLGWKMKTHFNYSWGDFRLQ